MTFEQGVLSRNAGINWKRVLWLSSPTIIPALWFEAVEPHANPPHALTRSAAMALAIALAAAVITMERRPSSWELSWAKLPLFRSRRTN